MVAMQLSTRQWFTKHLSLALMGLPVRAALLEQTPLRPRPCIVLPQGTHSLAQIPINIDEVHPVGLI